VSSGAVISSCPLPDGAYAAILVDSGFVPGGVVRRRCGGSSPSARGRVPAGRRTARSLRAAVLARRAGGVVWYVRDLPRMAAATGLTDVAPVFLMLESPPPLSGLPRPAPLPTRIPNNHLGYALTWFGLAAALLGVYGAMMFKRPEKTSAE
jgi:surfeit locus 1 family protein